MYHTIFLSFSFLFLFFSLHFGNSSLIKAPPIPIIPMPSAHQLQWQLSNMAIFFHFGPNTFSDSEWGSGHEDPSIFNPSQFNATQWVQVAKESGFRRVILTAKHHDGFCLWPSRYTNYSVESSGWRSGKGDVVAELAMAAKQMGLELGLYLSPWDRHEVSYGNTREYNEYYMGQMTELLTHYGEIKEVWLDGAKGKGEKDMKYFFDTWFGLIHQLQPGAVIFSDAGPDVRWVGDEAGRAAKTCWSLFNRSDAAIGATPKKYSQGGDPRGHDWVPAECDVSIRPGWFWHKSESPKSAVELLNIYYNSVGRNCLLLLNVPPNSHGLISPEDIQVLKEFRNLRNTVFSSNLLKNATVTATGTRGGDGSSMFSPQNVLKDGIDTYWAPGEAQSQWVLHIHLKKSVSFNVLQVQEPIQMGQRIAAFHLEVQNKNKQWVFVANGTTVGFQRLLRFPKVETQKLKFVVGKSRADPLIAYVGAYMDDYSIHTSRAVNKTSLRQLISTTVVQKNRKKQS